VRFAFSNLVRQSLLIILDRFEADKISVSGMGGLYFASSYHSEHGFSDRADLFTSRTDMAHKPFM
jgi:hypothetical protein